MFSRRRFLVMEEAFIPSCNRMASISWGAGVEGFWPDSMASVNRLSNSDGVFMGRCEYELIIKRFVQRIKFTGFFW